MWAEDICVYVIMLERKYIYEFHMHATAVDYFISKC